MYTIILSLSKSVSNFLLICSCLFLTGSNYYFKETLNFSKKFQSKTKLFKYTRRLFSKEVRKFSEDYNNIIRNDFYEIPMIPTELQITSKKILPIVHLT